MINGDNALLEAWTAFLAGSTWHHVATLTTRIPYSEAALGAELRDRFIRRLARMAGHSVAWFAATELTYAGCPHLHVLLGGTARLKTEQLTWAWKAGHSRITVLRSRRAAARYVAKELGRHPDNYDLSRVWVEDHSALLQALREAAANVALENEAAPRTCKLPGDFDKRAPR
jgi:hypothetical protein